MLLPHISFVKKIIQCWEFNWVRGSCLSCLSCLLSQNVTKCFPSGANGYSQFTADGTFLIGRWSGRIGEEDERGRKEAQVIQRGMKEGK